MNIFKFKQSVLLVIVILLSGCDNGIKQQDERSVARLGTSSVGSTFYIIANGFSNLIQNHAAVNITVEPIGGSYANIFSLQAGKIDYAITNSGAAYDGRYGVPPFKAHSDISLIAQGQASYRFVLVRRDREIQSLEDLDDKILIGRRPALPELSEISSSLVEVANLTDLKIVSTKNTKESLRHIKSGTVDGMIIPGGTRVPAVVQLFRDELVDPLYIPDDIFDTMKAKVPEYMFTHTFPSGHFEGQQKPFSVFGLNTYLVAAPHASDKDVYLLTKSLFENLEEFGTFHNEAKKWTLGNTLTDPKIPFHSGAVRYFKEQGVWTEELESIQNKLLNL